MRRISAWLFTIFLMFVGVGVAPAHAACTSEQIDVLGDGTQCETTKFSLTTTDDIVADDVFRFTLSASGTFYVDCGTDGVLSGTGASGRTITRSDTTPAAYTCTYSSAGAKTLKFGGTATGYNTNYWASAISFGRYYTSSSSYTNLTPAKIASVSGNLSSMFPWLSGNTATGAAPRFYYAFFGATNLTSVPDTLFANYTTGASYMFASTFLNCTGLTSIPAGLFSGITTGATRLFNSTFNGCTGLTTIPAGLFSGITTGASSMFYSTFQNCTGLTSIPAGLFSGITTSASEMFRNTFYGCSGLTSIPAGLFSGITSVVSGIKTSATDMFRQTFYNCNKLTSLPAGLFSGITTGASNMFQQTFYGCTSLAGYIPPTTFKTGMGGYSYMWSNTFNGTQLLTSCPCGTKQYITGYEGSNSSTTWNGKVSCEEDLEADLTQCKTCEAGTTQVVTPGIGVTCEPIGNSYSITYSMNGGTNYENAPSVYYENIGVTINGIPTKEGYTFAGWCTDSTLETCAMTQTIGTDATGNKTFYAKWSQCQACAATNASCSLSVVNNTCTYTTSCNTGYGNIQNNGAYNASCSANSGGNTCQSGEIDLDGTCVAGKFAIKTTNLNANDTFQFSLSAQGTFYVDCGTDGVLSGTGVSGKTIIRSNTTPAAYTCTYSSAGAKTIKFAGTATGYNTNYWASAINFGRYYTSSSFYTNLTPARIASVSGNLSDIFPWLSGNTADGAAPSFYYAFYGATNLTSVPDTLFANYTTGASYMFSDTFNGCTGLTSIPAGLFSGITTGASSMFHQTFRGCTGLITIGDGLFSGITTGAGYMFSGTFTGCTGLTSIPATLFSGITTSASSMFQYTFYGCTGLTSIPATLFSGITTGAGSMFNYTFQNCTGLTSIPATLFSGITTGAYEMFSGTFSGCTGLTSIPATLFSGITTGAGSMFQNTFSGCTGLTSIPAGLFSGITTGATTMFYNTFSGCTGLTSIPATLFNGITTSASYMFQTTFQSCTGLTSIPAGLFSGITTGAYGMFYQTFYNCTSLASYIPPTTFAGLTAAGAPTATQMFYYTFNGTNLATSCPCGMKQFLTGYEGASTTTTQLGGRVSCEPDLTADLSLCKSCEAGTTQVLNPDTGEITCEASGQTPTTYNITYTMNDGTNYVNAPATYTYGTGATIDGTPTKNGHTFAGWCTDAELESCAMTQTIGTDATGDKTFYAKWTQCQACAATNATCSLSVVNNTCTYTTACESGYENIQNNGAYNASCSANSYAITYVMNDGTNYANAPTTYTSGTGVTIDGTPTKNGHTFAGWCTDSTLETCAMTQTIGTEATGDKTFYAKWTQCQACAARNATCTLSVVNNACKYATVCKPGYSNIQNNGAYNASCSGDSIYVDWVDANDGLIESGMCAHDENLVIPRTIPTKRGHRFSGWRAVPMP